MKNSRNGLTFLIVVVLTVIGYLLIHLYYNGVKFDIYSDDSAIYENNRKKQPINNILAVETKPACSSYKNSSTCTNAGCRWDKNTCINPCSSYKSSNTCTNAGCSWENNKCVNPCSSYKSSSNCVNAGCRWSNNTCTNPCSSYKSSNTCTNAGCSWENNKCVNPCSNYKSSSSCVNAGCRWDKNTCINPCSSYETSNTCTNAGCSWENNKCVTPCSNYKNSNTCENAGCRWSNNTCTNPCSSYENSNTCTNAGCRWDNNICVNPCSNYKNSNTCENAGCRWDNNKCVNPCSSYENSNTCTNAGCQWKNNTCITPESIDDKIVFEYDYDNGNYIYLINQFPLVDEIGKSLVGEKRTQDFKLRFNKAAVGVKYTITAEKMSESDLDDEWAKLFLVNDGADVSNCYRSNGRVKTFNEYQKYNNKENEKIIYEGVISSAEASRGYKDFTFRMWVSEDLKLENSDYLSESKTYIVRINVYATE